MLTGFFSSNPFLPFCYPGCWFLRKIEFPDFTDLETVFDVTGFDGLWNTKIGFHTGLLIFLSISTVIKGCHQK